MERELQNIYGSSYFGSAGGWGVVRGIGVRCVGERDNGFVSGPRAIIPADPTKPGAFRAKGGDNIGQPSIVLVSTGNPISQIAIGRSRTWSEGGLWVPSEGWVPLDESGFRTLWDAPRL